MCQTWQVRHTRPFLPSWQAISIPRHTTTIAGRQQLLRPRAPQKRCHLMLASARCSSRAAGPLSLGTMNVKQMLHDLNGHGSTSQMAFQFSYHTVRNRVLVTFRPELKDCTGRVTLSRPLSLLLGWPDQETVLMGQGNTRHMAPSQPRQDPVESLFVHCDLAADTHVVSNVRNYLLCSLPTKGRYGQVMCYEPQQLDWLPVRWTEFQHVHVVITDGQGQKVPFEGGTCAVKLLLRWRDSYFRL